MELPSVVGWKHWLSGEGEKIAKIKITKKIYKYKLDYKFSKLE